MEGRREGSESLCRLLLAPLLGISFSLRSLLSALDAQFSLRRFAFCVSRLTSRFWPLLVAYDLNRPSEKHAFCAARCERLELAAGQCRGSEVERTRGSSARPRAQETGSAAGRGRNWSRDRRARPLERPAEPFASRSPAATPTAGSISEEVDRSCVGISAGNSAPYFRVSFMKMRATRAESSRAADPHNRPKSSRESRRSADPAGGRSGGRASRQSNSRTVGQASSQQANGTEQPASRMKLGLDRCSAAAAAASPTVAFVRRVPKSPVGQSGSSRLARVSSRRPPRAQDAKTRPRQTSHVCWRHQVSEFAVPGRLP